MNRPSLFLAAGLILAGADTGRHAPAPPPASTAALAAAPRPSQDTINFLIPQRSLGAVDAPVTVIEMSDFQCPFCRRHALETFPAIQRDFINTGKVRWIFINFPLTSLHPNAAAAAEFAMCAAKAGRFWPIHDLIYRNQATWAPLADPAPVLLSFADSIGLARDALRPCLDQGLMRELVRRDAEAAARAGANSTPTFFIAGGLLRGMVPPEVFEPLLDSIYQAKVRGK